MSANPQHAHWTVDEYLAMERDSDIKHEFINGEIFAMAGASENHNLISLNIGASLLGQLRGTSCRTYPSDMRVRVANKRYVYPDASVVCDPPQFSEDSPPSLLNPVLVVEVLSESTFQRDRGIKAMYYRMTESIQAYLLVSQDSPHIEQYVRQDDGSWRFTEVIGLQDSMYLPTIDCTLSMAEVYERVEFPEVSDDEELPPTL